VLLACVMAGGVAAVLALTMMPALPPRLPLNHIAAAAAPGETMDLPLHVAVIDDAAREAQQIARNKDEMALAAASRDCHHALRAAPDLTQLDRCAAFDDAVVQLQDRDPLRDRGPFGELDVTSRQWSAASQLSSDYLAMDSRLNRIRVQVELALAPPEGAQEAAAAPRPRRGED
jgi:hypothetical protein